MWQCKAKLNNAVLCQAVYGCCWHVKSYETLSTWVTAVFRQFWWPTTT
jgi:hypothetical protein